MRVKGVKMERDNTFIIEFKYDGHKYMYSSTLDVSCQNVYYTGIFLIDGIRKDVRLFKKLLKEG